MRPAFDSAKHPRQSDGTFATKGYADAGDLGLESWRPNEDFPWPQANDLDKVVHVVEAVEAGADTAFGIAAGLGVVDREGAYFADAAGWLGLVDKVDDVDGFKVYELSADGSYVAGLSAPEQSAFVASRLNSSDVMAQFRSDPQAFEATLGETLSESTVKRRMSTFRAWDSFAQDPERLAAAVAGSMPNATAMAQARQVSTADRARRRPAQEPASPVICTSCFLAAGLTETECSNCGAALPPHA